MAINLRFWNPHSERIWWVKHVLFYHVVVYDRFEALHLLCRFWPPTSIFIAIFYLLKVSFWMAINLIFWNPYSERILWVKQVLFYHVVVYDRFEGLQLLCRFWRPTSIFFATFYLLKVSFLMEINLRFWNPHSERIWWVKQVHFYHVVDYDRFEDLHLLCRFWRPTSIFFATFYLLNVSFWMAINQDFEIRTLNVYDGLNRSFFNMLSFPTVSKIYTCSVDSDAQPLFFSRLSSTFKRFSLNGNQSKILKSALWTYMMG